MMRPRQRWKRPEDEECEDAEEGEEEVDVDEIKVRKELSGGG